MGKRFWQSKTFWVNCLAILAVVVSDLAGVTIPETVPVLVLGLVNLILRLVTKQEISWDEPQAPSSTRPTGPVPASSGAR
jgi:hypothetical protein